MKHLFSTATMALLFFTLQSIAASAGVETVVVTGLRGSMASVPDTNHSNPSAIGCQHPCGEAPQPTSTNGNIVNTSDLHIAPGTVSDTSHSGKPTTTAAGYTSQGASSIALAWNSLHKAPGTVGASTSGVHLQNLDVSAPVNNASAAAVKGAGKQTYTGTATYDPPTGMVVAPGGDQKLQQGLYSTSPVTAVGQQESKVVAPTQSDTSTHSQPAVNRKAGATPIEYKK